MTIDQIKLQLTLSQVLPKYYITTTSPLTRTTASAAPGTMTRLQAYSSIPKQTPGHVLAATALQVVVM